MGFKKSVFYVLYYVFDPILPYTHSFLKIGQKRIRSALVRGFSEHIGKKVRFDKHVVIRPGISIGDNVGIGAWTKIWDGHRHLRPAEQVLHHQ